MHLSKLISSTVIRVGSLAGLCFLGYACANDVGADEDAPFDDRSNEAQQGLYDCTESSATGYRNGGSFGIKVVHVDGKPVQVDTANAYVALQKKAKTLGVN